VTSCQVRYLRGTLSASRPQVARLLGVSEATVVRWEDAAKDATPHGVQAVILRRLMRFIEEGRVSVALDIVRRAQTDLDGALTDLFSCRG